MQGGASPDYQRVDRCITMINALLDESEAESTKLPDAQRHGAFDRGTPISITLSNQYRSRFVPNTYCVDVRVHMEKLVAARRRA